MGAFFDFFTFDNILDIIQEHHAMKSYWGIALVGSGVMTAVAMLVDFLLPMDGVGWGILRAVLALVAGAFYFMVAYAIALFQSDSRAMHYDDNVPVDEVAEPYTPYRLRDSLKQRRRKAYPAMAVIAVIAIASAYSHVYTTLGGVVVASVIALISYIRPTDEEKVFLINNIPDPRDILDIREEIEREEIEQKAKERARALKKAKKDAAKE